MQLVWHDGSYIWLWSYSSLVCVLLHHAIDAINSIENPLVGSCKKCNFSIFSFHYIYSRLQCMLKWHWLELSFHSDFTFGISSFAKVKALHRELHLLYHKNLHACSRSLSYIFTLLSFCFIVIHPLTNFILATNSLFLELFFIHHFTHILFFLVIHRFISLINNVIIIILASTLAEKTELL